MRLNIETAEKTGGNIDYTKHYKNPKDKKMKINNSISRLSLSLILGGATVMSMKAQSKFHVDIDYHYNLGLSMHQFGKTYGRSDYNMGGHSLRLSTRYDVAPKFSVGAGIGLERYTADDYDYNTLPIYATLRYKPLKSLAGAYVFTDIGYAVSPSSDFYKGFTDKLGIGYTVKVTRHFGVNFQVAYDFKDFRDITTGYIDYDTQKPVFYNTNTTRHSLSFGVGVTF